MILSVDKLEPGMTVARDVKNVNEAILLVAGTELTSQHLRRLKMWGIDALHVADREGSAAAQPTQVPAHLQQSAEARVQRRFKFQPANAPALETWRQVAIRRTALGLAQQAASATPESPSAAPPPPPPPQVPRQPRATDVRAFVQRIPRLPSLSTIYYDLVREARNPEASIDAVSAIIAKDQSLASRVLRLANSVFYALPTEIGTLNEAVQLIGMHEIQNLVLATSVIKAFERMPTKLVSVAGFWRHSISCGLASSILADRRHDPLPERFFVGGLLHDIGRLVLFINSVPEALEVLRRSESESRLAHEIEREILGFDHAALGAELLSFWKLPHSLSEMVGGHHDSFRPPGSSTDSFHIHYADFIISVLELGSTGEVFVPPLVVPSNCHRFLLDEESIPALVEELDAQCDQVFPLLAPQSA